MTLTGAGGLLALVLVFLLVLLIRILLNWPGIGVSPWWAATAGITISISYRPDLWRLARHESRSEAQSGKQNPNGPKPGNNPGNTLGGTQGDTHLGEFPAPVAYQHFYLPGEHGPPIAVHDARYVLFRLPEAMAAAANGGKLMLDTSGPHATTPYVNVPFNESHPLEVAPNEQQLVPPRYRDLIR